MVINSEIKIEHDSLRQEDIIKIEVEVIGGNRYGNNLIVPHELSHHFQEEFLRKAAKEIAVEIFNSEFLCEVEPNDLVPTSPFEHNYNSAMLNSRIEKFINDTVDGILEARVIKVSDSFMVEKFKDFNFIVKNLINRELIYDNGSFRKKYPEEFI